MKKTPDLQDASIVLLGQFNPLIFRPGWFAQRELIGENEAEQASIDIIHPDVVIYKLDWLQVQVQRNRFLANTLKEPIIKAYDLVLGCFKRLKDTPIGQIGMNKTAHIDLGSEEAWHKIGDVLTPKDIWNRILPWGAGEKRCIGMNTLVMELSNRPGGHKGYTRVKAEPSTKFKYGLFLEVNDHYQLDKPDEVTGCDEIMGILENEWSDSMERADKIIKSIMGLV